jgi:hypothetical protein
MNNTMSALEFAIIQQSIAFDPTKVFGVLVPSDTVRHVDCERLWTIKTLVCEYCISLKYSMAKQKTKA